MAKKKNNIEKAKEIRIKSTQERIDRIKKDSYVSSGDIQNSTLSWNYSEGRSE